MNRKFWTGTVLVVVLVMLGVTAVAASSNSEGAQIRAATVQYHDIQDAVDSGYGLVPGLDHCFENPGVGAMGFHYINTGILDLAVELEHPEAIVYEPLPNGKLQMVAVEYIVPAEAWDNAGNSAPPVMNGRSMHLNDGLGVYVLHAWVWKNNPAGMFEDWNPKVSCQ